MLAYCGNNPIENIDRTGHSISPTTTIVSDISTQSHQKDAEIEFMYYCKANNITTYSNPDAAAEAWAKENGPLSKECERMSYIYEAYGHYFYTDVYEGSSGFLFIQPNVVLPTIAEEVSNYISPTYNVVAQIHSHPESPLGKHSDYPSFGMSISGGDRIAWILFQYPEMYIVPYSRCSGTPEVIKISDPSTWCKRHSYWFIRGTP